MHHLYMKTFVQLASRNNHKVLGFCTSECINSLGNMWEYIKNFMCPIPFRTMGPLLCRCCVITFENSSFDLLEVTYEV